MTLRKFTLNLILPAFGLLRPWDVLVEHKWIMIALWLYLPIIFISSSLVGNVALTDAMVGIVLFHVALTSVFLGIWIIGSVRDTLSISKNLLASSESSLDFRRASMVFLSVLFPYWAVASNISRLVREMEGLPHWWVIVPYVLIVITFLALTRWGQQRGNSSGSWTSFMAVAVAPMFGLLGMGYFHIRKFIPAVVFLLSGWVIIGFLVWVPRIRLIEIEGSMIILIMVFVHGATVLYMGLWLWGIADYLDMVEDVSE